MTDHPITDPRVEPADTDSSDRDREEASLDEALKETFPASDPIASARVDWRDDPSRFA